jgi:hypothetical protein
LRVKRLTDPEPLRGLFLVSFEHAEPAVPVLPGAIGEGTSPEMAVRRMRSRAPSRSGGHPNGRRSVDNLPIRQGCNRLR